LVAGAVAARVSVRVREIPSYIHALSVILSCKEATSSYLNTSLRFTTPPRLVSI
jgi:hypothetical protein